MTGAGQRMTVVIPTYRRPDLLEACLGGLAAQTRAPDEVVLVIRSTDTASLAVLERWPGLPLRVVEPAAPGFVHALSAGMAAVAEGIAVIADDDTVAAPDWVERYERAFVPGVEAVGGFNQVFVGGDPHYHTSTRVGRLSYSGRMVGMHYARSGLEGVDVEHLQGCNMAFRAPCLMPDPALRGDGAYMELDLCLRAAARGRIVYDERIHVDHHLGGREVAGDVPLADALAARRETDRGQVAASCWNYAYVLAKNTDGRLRRAVQLAHGLLVGQRRLWGLGRVAAEAVRHPSREWAAVLRIATTQRLAGWRAGSAVRLGRTG